MHYYAAITSELKPDIVCAEILENFYGFSMTRIIQYMCMWGYCNLLEKGNSNVHAFRNSATFDPIP